MQIMDNTNFTLPALRGKITRKAVILVSQKRKEPRNNAAKHPLLIHANTPSTGLEK